MQKPRYDYEALKQGLGTMKNNIHVLQTAIKGAEQQKAQSDQMEQRAEDQLAALRVELGAQMERQAEFRALVKQHEAWRKTGQGREELTHSGTTI